MSNNKLSVLEKYFSIILAGFFFLGALPYAVGDADSLFIDNEKKEIDQFKKSIKSCLVKKGYSMDTPYSSSSLSDYNECTINSSINFKKIINNLGNKEIIDMCIFPELSRP